MVKALVHDPIFLAQKSKLASKEDMEIIQNLKDTLLSHRDTCVGMAANMIGERKRIICFFDGSALQVMCNPVLLKKEKPYDTEESCLSLLGGPFKTKRFQKIKVQYETEDFKCRLKTYEGFTAQIIQHEIDHCDGILI